MGKHGDEQPEKRDEDRAHPSTRGDAQDTGDAPQPEPGSGGLTEGKYDEALDEAVKDVHG